MWKPPERIKHKPQPGLWPSREQAAASLWFSPLQLGPVTLEQRTWVPAMVPWRASEDGHITEAVLDWYERFAKGRPGALVVEATGIQEVPSGPLLRIGHERYLAGLRELMQTVRHASGGHTRLFIQLIDFLNIRRRPDPAKYFQRFLSITQHHRDALGAQDWSENAVREHLQSLPDNELEQILTSRELQDLRMGYRERITDLHLPHIRALPQVLPTLFANAAERAEQAGFDGVELHYAHAYTMASFLSPLNTRSDGYGGDRQQRLRLPLEVFAAVRQRVKRDFAVGCRFLSEECFPGGGSVEDAKVFGLAFARAGMDFLSTSRGGKFDDAKQPAIGWAAYPYTGPSGYECMPQYLSDAQGPFGRNIKPTARIRSHIRAAGFTTPVIVSGGIHGFQQAEKILQSGQADAVGAARQTLADPDWFEKIRRGFGDQVRVCEYTNYCEGLDQKHKQVTCQLWDRQALDEAGVKFSHDGKRRLTAPLWQVPKESGNGKDGVMNNPQIQLYTSVDGQVQLEVSLDRDTVWLTQAQMCELFDKNKRTVSEHIRNIFKEAELDENSVVRKFRTTAADGKNYDIGHYNLDVAISVGYRVKSQRGVQFRQWATSTLKQHLVEGYTLNQRRLQDRGIEFDQAVSLLSRTLANQQLIQPDGEAVISVIADYARSWSLLQAYDEHSLTELATKQGDMQALTLDEVLAAIAQLKQQLIQKGEATELFGQIRGDGLASALATIEQGFGDELFYPNVASRAAHLLYFVIKNYPLADGNKRTGSFLFLCYLRLNQRLLAKPVAQLINENTLVALALLVAQSLPDQKELMIRLIEHFILLRE